MSAASLDAPYARALTRPGVRVFGSHIFRAAVALIALHIVDDEFLQRAPGTLIGDHLRAGLLPIGVALVAAWAYPRLRAGLRAGIALIFGILSIVAGMIAFGSASADGVSGSDWSGLLLLPTGLALIALAAWTPWHERGRYAETAPGRWLGRAIAIVVTPLVLFYIVTPIGAALWATHKFRSPIGSFGIPHQDVSFRTSDGLLLSGWYVPSQNGAAIVIVHGGGGDRDGDRTHAAMLARAGYGVLLYDARGRGQSQGAPDAYGWTWGRDVDAAVAWLERRPDVRNGRIGALGLSTGADALVEAAARRHDIRAVVADGSTTRSTSDTAKVVHGGGLLSMPFWWAQYTAAETFENASPGPPLATLAAHVHARILFIASTWSVERTASTIYARAANQPGDLWDVNAAHTQGLHDHPRQYTQRVLSFFATSLLQR
jgi:dienelactone hydrolase